MIPDPVRVKVDATLDELQSSSRATRSSGSR